MLPSCYIFFRKYSRISNWLDARGISTNTQNATSLENIGLLNVFGSSSISSKSTIFLKIISFTSRKKIMPWYDKKSEFEFFFFLNSRTFPMFKLSIYFTSHIKMNLDYDHFYVIF